MGQQESVSIDTNRKRYHYQAEPRIRKPSPRIQHEGLLKLTKTPFRNCIQIQSNDNSALFLQAAQITLCDLLESRLFTNRLFTQEDIEKLIESVVYTMAYLQENDIVYRDICTENIYYDEGCFKLLPNQLIPLATYETAFRQIKRNHRQEEQSDDCFIMLSPEMIIALRSQEPEMTELEYLQKSNVFIFGMILLEVTTLFPSSECYDTETYDILDGVITQRLGLVEDHYSEKIARIIGNMLDYDYSERMDLRELSIFVNREFNENKGKESRVEPDYIKEATFAGKGASSRGVLTKSRMVNSRAEKFNQNQHMENSKHTASRSNLVYMQYEENCDPSDPRNYRDYVAPPNLKQQQKNRVYLKDPNGIRPESEWKLSKKETGPHYPPRKHLDYHEQENVHHHQHQSYSIDSPAKIPESPRQKPYMNAHQGRSKKTFSYYPPVETFEEDYPNLRKREPPIQRQTGNELSLDEKMEMGRPKTPSLYQSSQSKKEPLRGSRERENREADRSISRIKSEIQKSRQVIQQLQKNEGLTTSNKYSY